MGRKMFMHRRLQRILALHVAFTLCHLLSARAQHQQLIDSADDPYESGKALLLARLRDRQYLTDVHAFRPEGEGVRADLVPENLCPCVTPSSARPFGLLRGA